jgi:transposase
LGKAEDISQAVDEQKGTVPDPESSMVLEFGAVLALYDLADRLGIIEMIDHVSPKRDQGLSIGQYMLIAAINRAVDPKSKREMAEWFSKTVLDRVIPARPQSLSSQRFWDHMHALSEDAMKSIEDQLTRKIVRRYQIGTDCLIYDTTNFFTFVNTKTSSDLPQRGHSKEKRTDLKIVGLAMMVSPDFHVPLFHEAYPGNNQDAKIFSSVIKKLKDRYLTIVGQPKNVTLVFDKGNNSQANMDRLRSGDMKFHVVGSLKLSQAQHLLDVEEDQFSPVYGSRFDGLTAYRTTDEVYGEEMTVLVTDNPNLRDGQLQGIQKNIETCRRQLKDEQYRLREREAGRMTKGKKPTVDSVKKRVHKILQKEFMKELFDFDLSKTDRSVELTFTFNEQKLEDLEAHRLGKTILYTDNQDWSNEKIISVYRSQYHIEHTFQQMKDIDHLNFRPFRHWTDHQIKVHAFYCVLAVRLCTLLQRELHEQGMDLSINRMLDRLAEIKQVINIYPKKGGAKKETRTFSLSQLDAETQKMMDILKLGKYKLKG